MSTTIAPVRVLQFIAIEFGRLRSNPTELLERREALYRSRQRVRHPLSEWLWAWRSIRLGHFYSSRIRGTLVSWGNLGRWTERFRSSRFRAQPSIPHRFLVARLQEKLPAMDL